MGVRDGNLNCSFIRRPRCFFLAANTDPQHMLYASLLPSLEGSQVSDLAEISYLDVFTRLTTCTFNLGPRRG